MVYSSEGNYITLHLRLNSVIVYVIVRKNHIVPRLRGLRSNLKYVFLSKSILDRRSFEEKRFESWLKRVVMIILFSLLLCLHCFAVGTGEGVEITEQNQLSEQNNSNPSSKNESSFQLPTILPLFKLPEKTRETVNLETERLPSKLLSVYDKSQNFVNQNIKVSTSSICRATIEQ